MNTRTLGGLGAAAAAMVAMVGLAGEARSDNTAKSTPPVPAALKGPAPVSDPQWESIAESFEGFKADTKPSRDTMMQFPAATEIKELKVVGGQRVTKGQVLVKARDSDILANIAQLKDLAENDNEIRGSEKQAALAQFKFDRLKNSQTYSPTEYQEAQINAEVARVQLDQARRNKIQNEFKLKQSEASYERYYLEAPFDGIIEEVMVELGEGVTEQTKVLHLVNIEKLWLDPYAATPETIKLKLKEGSPAWVLIDMPDAPRLVKGRVLYVSPVADSVSQTRRVRVEMDNPEGWPAGTQARVRFTEPGKEWEKYQAKSSPPAGVSALPSGGFRQVTDLDLSNVLTSAPKDLVWKQADPAAIAEVASCFGSPEPGRSICIGARLLEGWPAINSWPPPVRSDDELFPGAFIPGPPGTKIGEPSK
jgi:RND family efflux transporter MFP subunit